jgi:hypothetical protein
MNQANDIVREHLQQHLVDLGNFRRSSDKVAKLAFHPGERRLHVTALVVVSEEFITFEIVEVEQPGPLRALACSVSTSNHRLPMGDPGEGIACTSPISNFVRIHKTPRVTPTMAAGVTDRLWSREEFG